ncbi:NACHT domain-containing protein [Azospirillum canadense]|uniref:NACHT domain-containing protein n=1 Tax=Azospirillum canadense TaxID=403962 RepID=UPI002226C463|nr:hypothetical protein [Azospirillum canadense]MCW2236017.1 GTPase SAR1 family protein [Azospirillum canadense]
MMLKPLQEYLTDNDRRELANVRACAQRILERPVDLAYTDHTISHKEIIVAHLDSFLRPWLAERTATHGAELVRKEVMVLLCATYLHDIGMQMVRPDILARLPSLTDDEQREAAGLSPLNVAEEHRAFARKHHHKIGHDWIMGSQGDIPGLPRLVGIDGIRSMVARVARAHNVWLTDRASYDHYCDGVEPQSEPEGEVRLDLLAAFLRLADILDQDKRRVDMAAMQRLPVSPVSKTHWWRHHFVNACRIHDPIGHNYPLKVAFRFPKVHEQDRDWLEEALYSATVKEVEAEIGRLAKGKWLGECGITIVLPEKDECKFSIDPDAVPMPDDVREAFRNTWRRAAGEVDRTVLREAAEAETLTADAVVAALPGLSAAVEIDDYIANTRRNFDGEFRDTPYSPLELRVNNQPELRAALEQLERQLQAPQARPHPIVLIGAPGGGKTMLLHRYVWEWSGGGRADTPLPLYIQSTRFGDVTWAAAVEARLGTYENPCSEREFQLIKAEALARFEALLAQTLCEMAGLKIRHEAAMRNVLIDILARTPLAILFDGVNELPPMLYKLANSAVHAFLSRYRGHRVIVTSRTGDFRPSDFPDRVTCELAQMSETAVADYWKAASVPPAVIRQFFDRATVGMRELVRTPMAAYMAGELLKTPDQERISNQGTLFQRYVRHALRQWRGNTVSCTLSSEQAHTLLAEIAFRAFESQQVAFRPKLATDIIQVWVAALDPQDAARVNSAPEDPGAVATRLLQELLSTGFLRQVGDADASNLRFRHHTLQDYFAAVAITSRWEQLPDIVAQPVFHEAVGLLPDVVDDPAGVIERLADATSNKWGLVELLPLLFRVIGSSRAPIPQRVKLRIYAATLPLYSAAVAMLSPFAVEVLCHLFSFVDWPVLAGFLAFIADEKNARPEWERELARADALSAMNREGLPTPETLRPFFAQRIPQGLFQDYESGKAAVLAMAGERDDGAILDRAPLFLGGLASSLSISLKTKDRAASVFSQLSLNQIGQLQAVFVGEAVAFGMFASWGFEIKQIHGLLISGIYEVVLGKDDLRYHFGDREFSKHYLNRWAVLGCKLALIERLVFYSADVAQADLAAVLSCVAEFDFPYGLVLGGQGQIARAAQPHTIHPDVLAAVKQRRDNTDNPFLAAWLYELLGEAMPDDQRRRLEPAIIAAGATGYLLCAANPTWPVPEELARYILVSPKSPISAAIDDLMAGDEAAFQRALAARGLNEQAITPFLDAVGCDSRRLTAIANSSAPGDRQGVDGASPLQ